MIIRRLSLIVLPLVAALAVLMIAGLNSSANHANAQSDAVLALDMDPDNGSGPCDPVDNSRNGNAGDTFKVAICLTDATSVPGDFDIRVTYDDTLDQCVPVDCPAGIGCLDTNPDANAGATTWTSPGLGTCDCSLGGEQPPVCDQNEATGPGNGQTLLWCDCTEATLPVGEGISAPLGMITFKNLQPGMDDISFATSSVFAYVGGDLVLCDKTECFGGTLETIVGLTPTVAIEPTLAPGETPGVEPTPGGEIPTQEPAAATAAAATSIAQGTPAAAINSAATATSAAVAAKAANATRTPKATAKPSAANEEGDGGSSGPNAFLIAGIVVVAAAAVGGGGWYGYRRFRLKK